MDRDRRIETLLPLRPVEFQILLSLTAGERHGYGILQEARELGASAPDIGTMYRALARMVDQGLIEFSDVDSERRNYYRLTGLGLKVAKAEAHRMEVLTRAARIGGLLKKEAK